MDRRQFNTSALAALAAAGLPVAALAKPGDDLGPEGEPVLPDGAKTYLTVTGGLAVLNPQAFTVQGVVVSGMAVPAGDNGLRYLGQAFIDALAYPGDVLVSFANLRELWSPCECLIEADGLAETLLADQPGVRLVSECGLCRSDLEDGRPPPSSDSERLRWCFVGPREPDYGQMLRKVFPVRRIHGDVAGEALRALQAARELAAIRRRVLSLHQDRLERPATDQA